MNIKHEITTKQILGFVKGCKQAKNKKIKFGGYMYFSHPID